MCDIPKECTIPEIIRCHLKILNRILIAPPSTFFAVKVISIHNGAKNYNEKITPDNKSVPTQEYGNHMNTYSNQMHESLFQSSFLISLFSIQSNMLLTTMYPTKRAQ